MQPARRPAQRRAAGGAAGLAIGDNSGNRRIAVSAAESFGGETTRARL
jgi:hypothetical protein